MATVFGLLVFGSAPAWAQAVANAPTGAPTSAQQDAQREFELGVTHFHDAQYEAAARAFLRADLAAPSSDALSNALVAARRAGSHILVATVADRALDRQDSDPGLVAEARRALSESLPHLARVELSCTPAPCNASIDNQEEKTGLHYLNPGTHHFWAVSPQDATLNAESVASLEGGTTYQMSLRLETDASRAKAGATAQQPSPQEEPMGWGKTKKIVFFSGVGATAVLTGLTIWSGAGALDMRNQLGETASAEENSHLSSLELRTDVLLSATLGTAALTTVWALFAPNTKVAEAPPIQAAFTGDGAWFSARGTFQ